MRTSLAVLAIATLTACGSPAPVADPVADEVMSYAPQAEVSPEPEPSPSPSPSPEVDNSANRTACGAVRRVVADKGGVFAEVAEGSSLPSDGADAAGVMQRKFRDTGLYAEGEIGVEIRKLATVFGQIRVALTTGDLDGLTAAVTAQNAGLPVLNKLCTAIGA